MSFVAPEACTLPAAARPSRLAEFESQFAPAGRGEETVSPVSARLRLAGPAGLADTVRDLAAREAECCSFFRFTVAEEGRTVTLDGEVPAEYAGVLAARVETAA